MQSDGKLFNLAQLKTKIKVCEAAILDMLFADDNILAIQTEAELQHLMNRFAEACGEIVMTISLNNTNMKAQNADLQV